MIEYNVKVDGNYQLVAIGTTVTCAPAPSAMHSAPRDAYEHRSGLAAAALYLVNGLLAGARGLLGFAFVAALLFWSELLFPVLRELILCAGGAVVAAAGWLTRFVGELLFDGGRAMLGRSSVVCTFGRLRSVSAEVVPDRGLPCERRLTAERDLRSECSRMAITRPES